MAAGSLQTGSVSSLNISRTSAAVRPWGGLAGGVLIVASGPFHADVDRLRGLFVDRLPNDDAVLVVPEGEFHGAALGAARRQTVNGEGLERPALGNILALADIE